MIMDNYQLKTQVEAERQLLACIFADEDLIVGVMAECLGMGIEEDMFTGVNKIIFNTSKQLFKEEEPIEAITVALKGKLDMAECTGIARLRDVPVSWKFFADELIRHDLMNRLNRTAMFIQDSSSADPEGVLSEAYKMLEDRPMPDDGKGDSKTITEGFIERVQAQEREGVNIVTGIDSLDRFLKIRKKQLITIAARPSVGKSALAGQIAFKNAVSYGKKVAFFSLEMSEDELMMRGLSLMSGVGATRIAENLMAEEQRGRVEAALGRIGEASLTIVDEPAQTADYIYSRCRLLQQKEGIDLVLIDYSQLCKPADGKAPRHEQIGQITRDFKNMAKKLDCPVIQLAQINREAAKSNRRPKMFDLRESGSLEQDSDTILFIHPKDPDDQGETVDVELIVEKQRNGGTGIVDLKFIKTRSYFKEYQKEETLV
jgi:replicative DNA helicase